MPWDVPDPCGPEVTAPSFRAGARAAVLSSPPLSPGARNASSAVPECWEDWEDAEDEARYQACGRISPSDDTPPERGGEGQEADEEPCAPAATDAPGAPAPSSAPAAPTPVSPGPQEGTPRKAPLTLDAAAKQYITDHGLEVLEFSRDKCLGKGAFGRAYLVQVPLPDGSRIPAVLKRMRATTSPVMVAAEVEALSRLRGCSGCVQLLAHGEHNFRQALLLEYCPGGTLADRLDDAGRWQLIIPARLLLPVPALREVAAQLLGALTNVHAAGLIHQDIKPDNLLYDKSGELHIADFGTAAMRLDYGLYDRTGAGSMPYMAPEVRATRSTTPTHPITDKADVYSAGITLLRAAWLHTDPLIQGAFLRGDIPAPSFMPEAFLRFIRSLLHEEPNKRPSAREALGSGWVRGCDE
ncbi:hypothetical protein HYH03_009108 [Edaphochlamys debaryana]|uniref:Protein kinase domain-containing protein n=1 Tax=Edaphochlamys debaryana TaxID=47281 RepID=A0A835Y562_9CHLO|nr:hypothetical protein HYH03_009108 [Edaphochlamys debaryana]|eukprot:KAG2492695.1 hypothetical protein HYH03_009108 [Edaphochlamys debaryana]